MKENLILLFDDHGKKLIGLAMGLLLFAMMAGPLFGAIEASNWPV